jgi:hypothetical protein
MTQHRTRAGGQDRRQPVTLPGQHAVPDRVDAAMDDVQQASRDTVIDRLGADSHPDQLRPRHQTMLSVRPRRDHSIQRSSVRFTPYFGVKRTLDRHAPMVARPA